MRLPLLLALLAASQLQAQEFYFKKVVPGSGYCPREEPDTQHTLTQTAGRQSRIVEAWESVDKPKIFPKGARPSAAKYGVAPDGGSVFTLDRFKGKVVVVGLFSTACDPSIRMIGELAQLQPKGAALGFEILPVHLESWINVGGLVRQNKQHFGTTRFYKTGLGEAGLSNLGPSLSALPTVVILDGEGNIACRWAGYAPGAISKMLSQLLMEAKAAEGAK
jgi:hypothetical protein